MKFGFNLNIKPSKTLSAFLEARTQSWVEDFFQWKYKLNWAHNSKSHRRNTPVTQKLKGNEKQFELERVQGIGLDCKFNLSCKDR